VRGREIVEIQVDIIGRMWRWMWDRGKGKLGWRRKGGRKRTMRS